jgi:hypothetical protein
MSSIYEYFFSQDSLVINYRGLDIVIVPGMKVHVRSKRLQEWCLDGIVKSIYKSGIYVSYGHSHYFSAFTRGNTKFVPLDAITKDLRFPDPRCLKAVLKADLKDEESSDDSAPS